MTKPMERILDNRQRNISAYLADISNIESQISSSARDLSASLSVEKFSIDMPVELSIENDENKESLSIGILPPIYYVKTSFESVFHQIKVTFERIDRKNENEPNLES